MLFLIKQKLQRQILSLALALTIAYSLSYFFSYDVILRLSFENFLKGVACALLLVVLHAFFWGILLSSFKIRFLKEIPQRTAERFRNSLRDLGHELRNQSLAARLGASVFTGGAEEFLLRAYAFGLLLHRSTPLAYGLNAILTFVLYFRGRKHLTWAILQTLEGTAYAFIFSYHLSYSIVAFAHAFSWFCQSTLLSQKFTEKLLANQNLRWRKIYADIAYSRH